jgi:putative oxygen-independent coproporphyrinogen III oxidase
MPDQFQASDYVRAHDSRLTTHDLLSAALYIHWPFCKKKCPYCDFNSHVREGVDHAAWAKALLREMGYWHARAPEFRISSIFFGGGTPSLMEPTTVAALIEEADRLWGVDSGCEITLEANPTSVEAAKFAALKTAGVNRVSLGVQSLRAQSLKFLGREHSASEALDAVALAAKTFDRYSFDLIYALPNQTLGEWENELREALTYARGHLSLYQLTIEENTAFHHAYHVGKSFQLPVDSLAAEMYQRTQAIMEEAGLPAYEISNHASAGNESRHNLSYWRSHSYFGIGPGAHGRITQRGHINHCVPNDKGDTMINVSPLRIATRTLKSPERWLAAVEEAGHGIEAEESLDIAAWIEEYVLMGLRLREGISYDSLPTPLRSAMQQRMSPTRMRLLQDEGLIDATPTSLRATPRGRLLLNSIIAAVLQ